MVRDRLDVVEIEMELRTPLSTSREIGSGIGEHGKPKDMDHIKRHLAEGLLFAPAAAPETEAFG